jgi:hypothetical protein
MPRGHYQFDQYAALGQKLKRVMAKHFSTRRNPYNPFAVARLMLTRFGVSTEFRILTATLDAAGVIAEGGAMGKTREFLIDMVAMGILNKLNTGNSDGRDFYLTVPGPIIAPYLLKERRKPATKAEVAELRATVERQGDQLATLQDEVRQIIETLDPPYTDEKRDRLRLAK